MTSKKSKKKFRKFDSTFEPNEGLHQLEMKATSVQRPRSRSITIQSGLINPLYVKNCGCCSILVVDDQYINRYIILQYAEKYDIRIDEAEDGMEAVAMVKETNKKKCCDGYYLILMDLNMPIMGGIEASRAILELKSSHQMSQILCIVAVTAFVSEKEKEKCLKAGMVDFIPKPFSLSRFARLISLH